MKLQIGGVTPAPQRGLFNDRERKRFRMLLITLGIVCVSFVTIVQKVREESAKERAQAQAQAAQRLNANTVIVTPEVDREKLSQLAHDALPEERVLVEPAALAETLRLAGLLSDALFEPMHGRELDAQACAELTAQPSPERGRLFRARGEITRLQAFEEAGSVPKHLRGELELFEGGRASFAVLDRDDASFEAGDSVRIDGLFLKVVRQESADVGAASQGWLDTPLIVGGRMLRSYPRIEYADTLARESGAATQSGQAQSDPIQPGAARPGDQLRPGLLDGVEDDSITGFTPTPFYPYWELMAYVAGLPEDGVDWNRAPVLDRATMAQLVADGDSLRGIPVRIPACEVLDCYRLAQAENPLRLTHTYEGWLGSSDWEKVVNGVVKFVSPHDLTGVKRNDTVTARGFFFRQVAYEPAKGGVSVVPLFVMRSVSPFKPPEFTAWRNLLIGFGVFVLCFLALLGVLLRRDRARSAEFQAELTARRRARARAHARA